MAFPAFLKSGCSVALGGCPGTYHMEAHLSSSWLLRPQWAWFGSDPVFPVLWIHPTVV